MDQEVTAGDPSKEELVAMLQHAKFQASYVIPLITVCAAHVRVEMLSACRKADQDVFEKCREAA